MIPLLSMISVADLPTELLDRAVMLARVGFIVAAGLFVVLLTARFARSGRTGGPVRLLNAICGIALVAILVHQSFWQLAGFRDARFVSFMKRYSRRVTARDESMQRGRIVDRNGIVLAETVNGRRRYPHGPAAAHITGYQDARYGMTGVERADDLHLRGAAMSLSTASLQRFARNLVNHRLVMGHDTVLTVDARLQAEAYRLMNGRRGAVVGVSPRDGAIVVMMSSPSFDPNALDLVMKGNTGEAVFLNRATSGLYPPGSTFKSLVAAVAAQHGMGGPLDCPGDGIAADTGARPIRDHEYYEYEREGKRWRGHGTIDIRDGLARSSNVYFAKLGLLLGAARISEVAGRFRLHEPYVFYEGSSGTMSGKASRFPALEPGDKRAIAQTAIGQGAVVVTPLHMVTAVAAIANGGLLCSPYLSASATPAPPTPVMSEHAARVTADQMLGVVRQGTGRGARIYGLPLAGKTGTAQTPSGDDHGWFVAFGPTSRPALALAVVVENSGYGSRHAVPIARQLFMAARDMGILDDLGRQESAQ